MKSLLLKVDDSGLRVEIEVVEEGALPSPAFEEGISVFKVTVSTRQSPEPRSVVLSAENASLLTSHSAFLVNEESLVLALGHKIVCLSLVTCETRWTFEYHSGACYRVFFNPKNSTVIVQAEISVLALDLDGRELWRAETRDIIPNEPTISEEIMTVEDFSGDVYRVDLNTGKLEFSPLWWGYRLLGPFYKRRKSL